MEREAALTPKQREELKQIVESAVLGFRASIAKELRVLTDLVQDPIVQEYLMLPPEHPPAIETAPDDHRQANINTSTPALKQYAKPGSSRGNKRAPRDKWKPGASQDEGTTGKKPRTSRNNQAPFLPEHRPQTAVQERAVLKKSEEEKKIAPRWNIGGKKDDKRGKANLIASPADKTKSGSRKPIGKASTLVTKLPEETSIPAEIAQVQAQRGTSNGPSVPESGKQGAPMNPPVAAANLGLNQDANTTDMRSAKEESAAVQKGQNAAPSSAVPSQSVPAETNAQVATAAIPTQATLETKAAEDHKGVPDVTSSEKQENKESGPVTGEANASATSPMKDATVTQQQKEEKKSGNKGSARQSSDKKKGGTPAKAPAFGPLHKR